MGWLKAVDIWSDGAASSAVGRLFLKFNVVPEKHFFVDDVL